MESKEHSGCQTPRAFPGLGRNFRRLRIVIPAYPAFNIYSGVAGWVILRKWTSELGKGSFSRKLTEAREQLLLRDQGADGPDVSR